MPVRVSCFALLANAALLVAAGDGLCNAAAADCCGDARPDEVADDCGIRWRASGTADEVEQVAFLQQGPPNQRALPGSAPFALAPTFTHPPWVSGRSPRIAIEEEESVEMAVSVMLVGCISFMMLLFYLVNFPDNDIKYYACHTLGYSISIFVGVLVYEAVDRFVMAYVKGQSKTLLAELGQYIVWFLLMQVVTAQLAGVLETEAIRDPRACRSYEDMAKRQADEIKWRRREVRLRCFSGMLTHVTGFAAIGALGELQTIPPFSTSPWKAALVAPLAIVATVLLYQASSKVRNIIVQYDDQVELSEQIWEDAATDVENDALSLAVSFVSVRAVQFGVLGFLPVREGLDESGRATTATWQWDLFLMLLLAAASGLLTLVLVMLPYWMHLLNATGLRGFLIAENFASMCFAWCTLQCVKAALHVLYPTEREDVVIKILTALVVFFLACVGVFAFDKLADKMRRGATTHQAIVKVILSFGVLIGFAWENCFYAAIKHISSRFIGPAHLWNLLMSLAICVLVVPAYLNYLDPIIEAHRRKVVSHLHRDREVSDIPRRLSISMIRSRFSLSRDVDVEDDDDNLPQQSEGERPRLVRPGQVHFSQVERPLGHSPGNVQGTQSLPT